MALELNQFAKLLEDTGILSGDTIRELLTKPEGPKQSEDLAKELIRQKKLTKFQVEELWKGRAKSLVLGNYLLLDKIGAGGMGQVFKALHRKMGRLVAVKVLPPGMTRDQNAIARFEREVQAAAKLRHPNIISADDADQANGIHFLVMELVDGTDLANLVKQKGPLGLDQAISSITQAAKGFEYAHSMGVIHRDIKPANLLIDKQGIVKILDLGLARVQSEDSKAQLTATGAVMGTVDYMAPEQAMNSKAADARADIYSLGCSLHYLLTGKTVYESNTVMGKLLAHRQQPIPSLQAIRPDVPAWLDRIFQKMVAKNLPDRYQSMTEVLADIAAKKEEQPPTPVSMIQSTAGLTGFFQDLNQGPEPNAIPKIQPAALKTPSRTSLTQVSPAKPILFVAFALVGACLLVLLFLFFGRSQPGTLLVEVNEPGAEIAILTETGDIATNRKSEKEPVALSIQPGKHRLRVRKDGFEVLVRDFEIRSGEEKPITAQLQPLAKKTALAKAPTDLSKPPTKDVASPTQPTKPPVVRPPLPPLPPGNHPAYAVAPFSAAQARKHQEEWAAHLKVPLEFTNSIGMRFILIPPGEFVMGCEEQEAQEMIKRMEVSFPDPRIFVNALKKLRDSTPSRNVRLTKAFYMGTHEVTNAQYLKVLGNLPEFNDPQKPNEPLRANASLYEGMIFCDGMNKLEKRSLTYRVENGKPKRNVDVISYRLPTEAEWEYACRAGTTGFWFFGDNPTPKLFREYQSFNSGDKAKPNPFGLFDMFGGSTEWCFDRHDDYKNNPLVDPYLEPTGGVGVHRGGSHYHFSGVDPTCLNAVARQPFRIYGPNNKRWTGVGRVVLPAEAMQAP